MEAVTGSDYTVVVVKEEEVVEKEEVEKAVADRKSLAGVEAVVAVEDIEFLVVAEAVEVKVTEEVADHMDSHILNTLHIQSLVSLLCSMQQQIVILKTERRNRETTPFPRGREKFLPFIKWWKNEEESLWLFKELDFLLRTFKSNNFGI